MKPIETERLRIRAFTMDDLDAILRILAAPEVLWLGGKACTLDQARHWLEKHIDDAHSSFGQFAVEEKISGVLVGLVALGPYLADFVRFAEDPQPAFNSIEVELGYALDPAHWHKGYATEAGRAMVEYAFARLRLPRLASVTSRDNARSIAVMNRLGCRIVPNVHPQWSHEVVGLLENRKA